ncbi:hypothetical protein P8C59_006478 [Phyllachora maydis]|uniref:Reverse transcriptase Ty1/copia-type domain-containing protein n=1 Tax=Phyllachora maydis TaxID=1825666 RepID=A0AAD9I8B1_9PEZI|nr:hypothetical protein P8C59_006478 [Phyllachora maydis]
MADQAKGKVIETPPIDIGSKEGFKDTITSSIVKELSKKAYTIPDDMLRALGISNFLENPNISNTYSDSDQAILLMLLYNSLSSSPRAAISRPIKSKKEDVYNEFHALTFSTYKKGLSAFNAEFNGYLAKLTMTKLDIDPSLILNKQARMLGLIASSLKIEYLIANILKESRNPAIEVYRAAYIAHSSNFTPNSSSNPSKKGKNKKKGKKQASYNIEGQNYSAKSAKQASFMLGSYNLAIEEEEEESDSSSNSGSSSDSNASFAQLLALKGYKKRKDFKGKGLKASSNKAKYKYNKPRRRPRDPAFYNMEIPSNSIRTKDYRPIIEDAIVSEAIEPKKRYKLRNSPAKGTTLEGIGPSLKGKRPRRPTREPKPLTGTGNLPYVLKEPVIEGNKVERAISSPALKKPNIGQQDYYILLNLAKLRAVLKTSTVKFIEDNTVLSQPTNDTALEGEIVDLDLDLEGAVSPDPSNFHTRKPVSIEIGPSKLEPYESSSDSKLDEPLLDKPINPVIVEFTRPPLSIRKPELPEWLSRSLNRPTKSYLNAAKNLFKYLNSAKDYSICFSYNGNTVANLGPKLSNSSNITSKLSRDFYSKEGPRPLTTTSTTIVDSRKGKGSSRTSIINSSLVPIGFSDSDFAGDKATSKSTYGYLYKLAGGPISWKTKRATTIALSTLEAETDGLTEAIREVQWIIGLFSELHRPIDYPITLFGDNQGSITVANDPALHARTKHTLLKFRYRG